MRMLQEKSKGFTFVELEEVYCMRHVEGGDFSDLRVLVIHGTSDSWCK